MEWKPALKLQVQLTKTRSQLACTSTNRSVLNGMRGTYLYVHVRIPDHEQNLVSSCLASLFSSIALKASTTACHVGSSQMLSHFSSIALRAPTDICRAPATMSSGLLPCNWEKEVNSCAAEEVH